MYLRKGLENALQKPRAFWVGLQVGNMKASNFTLVNERPMSLGPVVGLHDTFSDHFGIQILTVFDVIINIVENIINATLFLKTVMD